MSEKTVKYVRSMLENMLAGELYKIDPQKVFILYFLVGSSKVLNIDINKQAVGLFIENLACKDQKGKIFGFRQSDAFPEAEAHVVHSYCVAAIYILKKVDKNSAKQWIESLINFDGSIRGSFSSDECDLRMIYSAVSYLDLLEVNVDNPNMIIRYILECQNPNGGFGMLPFRESHGGSTYCGVASLQILKHSIPQKTQLINWLIQRYQAVGEDEAGNICHAFQGRVNKVTDSCYGFWIGWTLQILNVGDFIDCSHLRNFLNNCESQNGQYTAIKYFRGFSRTPGNFPDPIHTCHALFAKILDQNTPKKDLLHALCIDI